MTTKTSTATDAVGQALNDEPFRRWDGSLAYDPQPGHVLYMRIHASDGDWVFFWDEEHDECLREWMETCTPRRYSHGRWYVGTVEALWFLQVALGEGFDIQVVR